MQTPGFMDRCSHQMNGGSHYLICSLLLSRKGRQHWSTLEYAGLGNISLRPSEHLAPNFRLPSPQVHRNKISHLLSLHLSHLPRKMADPSTQPHSTQNTTTTNDQDFPPSTAAGSYLDADLEMEDDTTRDPPTQHGQDTSSSTLDHEPTTQTDTQQQQKQEQEQPNPTSNGPPPSRKDASLREFLGKMDDYAPIVSPNPPTSPTLPS
jgi:hypothetical protein